MELIEYNKQFIIIRQNMINQNPPRSARSAAPIAQRPPRSASRAAPAARAHD